MVCKQYLVFFSLILFVLSPAQAASLSDKTYGSVIVSEVTSIYDADTFRVNIKDWPEIVGYRMSVRVNGIDAPEMKGKCKKEKELARKAKQYTVGVLRAGKRIDLRKIKRGKYFRLLADVYVDGKNLSDGLVDSGFAVKYDGGTKVKDWCK